MILIITGCVFGSHKIIYLWDSFVYHNKQ